MASTFSEKLKYFTKSVTFRLIVPIILTISITLVLLGALNYRINQEFFSYHQLDALQNTLQLTEKALQKGWENTTGTALRTEKLLRDYTTRVMSGRLDYLGFSQGSGIVIVDSFSQTILQTYPSYETPPPVDDIKEITKHQVSNYTSTLSTGGQAISSYFAPMGLHLISYSNRSFEDTRAQKILGSLITLTFLGTAIVITTLILIIMFYSLIKPLLRMNKNIKNIIATDKFEDALNPKEGSIEVQNLTKQVNTLLSHIKDRDEELHKHNERLEYLVTERTTDLKKAQEQLVLSERLAAIGEFASSVAHELRNPLASIKLGADKLSAVEGLQPNDQRRLELIQKETVRLSDMLKGILSFAAPSAIQLSTYNLKEILAETKPIFFALAKEEQTRINPIGFDVDILVETDIDKTKQALINLTKNACEACVDGGEVDVSISHTAQNAVVTIHNPSEPISKEALERLFEPFFTTKTGGTGLGLPTTKRLMNEMGG